jgi:predicted RNA binding protein YcfA (HicA-like mRNA interferase family)
LSRSETLGLRVCPPNRSHRQYVKGSLHPCVPMHRSIKPKTLQSILKQADITIEELADNL